MDSTLWAAAIAFGGVVLGVVVTFVSQWLTRRQTSALSIAQQKADLRKDRREAIYAFLEVAAAIYEISEARDQGEKVDDRMRATEQQLEFRRRCIHLLCTAELRSAADEYTRQLFWLLVEDSPGGVIPEEENFYDVARQELYAPKVTD